jgi:hypothetical protein
MKIDEFQHRAFNFVVYVSYFLYFLIAFGLLATAPQYLEQLHYFIKLYISLFLIIRFNPLRKLEFSELDKEISFSAGVFLLTTTAITELLIAYLTEIKNYLKAKTSLI